MSYYVCLFVCLSIRPSVCLPPACLSICLPPAAAFHPYCPQGFGNNFRRKYTQSRVICQSVVVKVASHVCKFGLFAPVIPLFHCYVYRLGLFAPVVLHIVLHVCKSWVSAPVVGFTCADCGGSPPSAFMYDVPEQRQGPAQLRVLRNSPRAMPLSGLPIIVMFAQYTSRKQRKVTARLCLRMSRDQYTYVEDKNSGVLLAARKLFSIFAALEQSGK